MKLTQQIRQAVALGVMMDVPEVDYFSKIKEMVNKQLESMVHPKVKAVLDDHDLKGMVDSKGCGRVYLSRYRPDSPENSYSTNQI